VFAVVVRRLVSSSDKACSQSGSDNDTAAEEQAEFERTQVLLVLQGITRKMDDVRKTMNNRPSLLFTLQHSGSVPFEKNSSSKERG
jgi:hypothetical protein